MVHSIIAPMEFVQASNLHEVLFSGSESKWYLDPLEPQSVPIVQYSQACRMKQTLFIMNNNEDIFFSYCFISCIECKENKIGR